MGIKLPHSSIRLFATIFGCNAGLVAGAESGQLPGGLDVSATLDAEARYDDNVTRANSDEIDSWVVYTRPEMILTGERGKNAYTLEYALNHAEYLQSSSDSFTDHAVVAAYTRQVTSRFSISLNGLYQDAHEERGTGFSREAETLPTDPNRYRDNDYNVQASYGAPQARGQLEVTLGKNEHIYFESPDAKAGSRTSEYGSARFTAAISNKTELIFLAAQRDFDYLFTPVGEQVLDSRENDYFAGVTWEAKKISASILGGLRKRKFDDPLRDDFSGPGWEATIDWTPRPHYTIALSTSRRAEESQGLGDFEDIRDYAVDWTHNWSTRLSSTVAYEYVDSAFKGTGLSESASNFAAGFSLEMNSRITLRGGIAFTDQGAFAPEREYQRSLSFIGFQARLK